jgi:hypothetical protein
MPVLKIGNNGLFFDDTGSGKNACNRVGRCERTATYVLPINWKENSAA